MEADDQWTGEARHYEAFAARDKATAMDIVRAAAPGRCPSYAYLLDLSYGRRLYTSFTLFYSFMSVTVRGDHLKAVVDAIKLRRCTRLQEFDPEQFDAPLPGEPVIHSIGIAIRPLSEAMHEAETTAERP